VDLPAFWQLIEESHENAGGDPDEQVAELTDLLSELPPDEIVAFDRQFRGLLADAYRWDLWGAAVVINGINGGCSDDGIEYFRCWLIGQGERVYREALADPESLVDRAEAGGLTEGESLLYAAVDAYKVETGRELPVTVQDPPEPAGEPWEEDELERRFPKLWAAFGLQ
jgi:hypothetical protein